jgi:hypothetical protein
LERLNKDIDIETHWYEYERVLLLLFLIAACCLLLLPHADVAAN